MNNAATNYNEAVEAYNLATIEAGYDVDTILELLAEETPRAAALTWDAYKRTPRLPGRKVRINRAMRRLLWNLAHAGKAYQASKAL